jgi:DNA-binding GntR family transcriptional regulator
MMHRMDEQWNLLEVKRSSTIEQVHRALRDAIIDGTIPPGSHLRELHLARLVGASRSTIREAIRQLVQEGLAASELHRGTFVSALSVGDRLDVYVAREAIEVGAATRLIARDGELDLTALEDALETLRRTARGRRRPTERVIAADVTFHQEFVRLIKSPRLDRAYETLAAETRILLRHHPIYLWRTYVADHEQLLDGLRRRDPQLPQLVAGHLRLSADLIGAELAGRARPHGEAATEVA